MEGRCQRSRSRDFRGLIAECEVDHDEWLKPVSRMGLGVALAYQGEDDAAHGSGRPRHLSSRRVWTITSRGWATRHWRRRRLAAGDVSTAHDASERGLATLLCVPAPGGLGGAARVLTPSRWRWPKVTFCWRASLTDEAISVANWMAPCGSLYWPRARIAVCSRRPRGSGNVTPMMRFGRAQPAAAC